MPNAAASVLYGTVAGVSLAFATGSFWYGLTLWATIGAIFCTLARHE